MTGGQDGWMLSVLPWSMVLRNETGREDQILRFHEPLPIHQYIREIYARARSNVSKKTQQRLEQDSKILRNIKTKAIFNGESRKDYRVVLVIQRGFVWRTAEHC